MTFYVRVTITISVRFLKPVLLQTQIFSRIYGLCTNELHPRWTLNVLLFNTMLITSGLLVLQVTCTGIRVFDVLLYRT